MIGRQDGLIIIAVLWMCALIMWFALQIGAETRLRGEEQIHALRRSQALHLAVGGAFEALGRMGQPLPIETKGTLEDNWQPDGQVRIVAYRTGAAAVIIEKETTKLNVNKAGREQLKAVIEKAGLDEDAADVLTDVIGDFIDPDDLVRLHGAEKDHYEQMGLRTVPFNGPLLSLDQMLLIPGVTQQLFFGYGRSADDAADNESSVQLPLLPGRNSLFQMLTVYGNNESLNLLDELELTEPEEPTWESGGIYRILSCGAASSGSPAVVFWLIVRYAPESKNGYEVLFRKIL